MFANLIGAAIVAIHIGRNEDYARSNCASAGVRMLLISGDPQRRESYFFKSDLLGFVLVWHVLHGWPFPIAGVASAFGAGTEIIARARKIVIPTIPPTTPSVIVRTDGIVVLLYFEHCNRQRSEESRQWHRVVSERQRTGAQ